MYASGNKCVRQHVSHLSHHSAEVTIQPLICMYASGNEYVRDGMYKYTHRRRSSVFPRPVVASEILTEDGVICRTRSSASHRPVVASVMSTGGSISVCE